MPCGWRRTGHASQTSVVYPPTGSREISTPPILLMGYGTPLPFYLWQGLYLHRCLAGTLGVCLLANKLWADL